MKELGVISISLTGGEIFLRSDIICILKELMKLKFIIILQTNGMLVSEKVLEEIKEYDSIFFKISFHSLSKIKFDNFVGVQGSFQKLERKLKLLKNYNQKIILVLNITNNNLMEYYDLKKYFKMNRVEYLINTDIYPNSEAREKLNSEYYCKDDDVLLDVLKDMYYGKNIKNYLKNVQCDAAILRMRINPAGKVFPCGLIPIEIGNIEKEDLAQIWENNIVSTFLKKDFFKSREDCSNCIISSYCNKCNAFIYDSKWNEIKKQYCNIANLTRKVSDLNYEKDIID